MCTAKAVSGGDMVQPYDGEQHQVVLADGWAVPIKRQTCSLTATIMTPWAPSDYSACAGGYARRR